MTLIELDTQGRLIEFRAVPMPSANPPAPTPWHKLFAAAGLDPAEFIESTPGWPPATYADERRAWTGTFSELPGKPILIEAAAYQGRPVLFALTAPWTRVPGTADPSDAAAGIFGGIVVVLVVGVSAMLAWRHWRAGRGDSRAAVRLALFFFGSSLAIWLVGSTHVHSVGSELSRFGAVLGDSLLGGGMAFIVYLALEPIVRRHWPRALVTWSRLVSGQFRDPLVGRDMLIGVVLGLATCVVARIPHYGWLPGRAAAPSQSNLAALSGWNSVIATLSMDVLGFSLIAMIAMLLLTLARWLVRKDWILIAGLAGLVGIGVVAGALFGRHALTGWQIFRVVVATIVVAGVVAGVATSIIRAGLFASAVMFFVLGAAGEFPLLIDTRQPAAPASWLTAALILAIAIVGFRLAVRPLAASSHRSP